jgi:hypothetical protein
MNGSDQYHQRVLEALSAFVREGAKPPRNQGPGRRPKVCQRPHSDRKASSWTGAVDLSKANIAGTDLTNSDLTGAYLGEANLAAADLTHANLTAADLTRADLHGARLTAANLSGANVRGALHLLSPISSLVPRTKLIFYDRGRRRRRKDTPAAVKEALRRMSWQIPAAVVEKQHIGRN